jgi:hypothetical protein
MEDVEALARVAGHVDEELLLRHEYLGILTIRSAARNSKGPLTT